MNFADDEISIDPGLYKAIQRSLDVNPETYHVGAQLEAETQRAIGGAVAFILAQAYRETVLAIAAMIRTDPAEVDKMRKLQNDVQRYIDLSGWVGDAIRKGAEAWKLLSDSEQDAILDEVRVTPSE